VRRSGGWRGLAVAIGLLAAGRWDASAADPAAARAWLAGIEPSPGLQGFLDRTVDELLARDAALRGHALHVALLEIGAGAPQLAQRDGESRVYPASVVKFVYLMAAYEWRDRGRLPIDPELDRLLDEMIRHSSNRATQQVVARLTQTEPGPRLAPEPYQIFRERRLAVKRWLETLGIADLHCIHPTFDGDGDLSGRDAQLLQDRELPGALPAAPGEFANRQAMTAVGTAKLLGLLATDRALDPASSAEVRRRMRRLSREQPYLARRIAGGAERVGGLEVYAKSGTWGPIFADAGIVRSGSGRQLVLVVFIDGSPPYRGDFIANLTERSARRLDASE